MDETFAKSYGNYITDGRDIGLSSKGGYAIGNTGSEWRRTKRDRDEDSYVKEDYSASQLPRGPYRDFGASGVYDGPDGAYRVDDMFDQDVDEIRVPHGHGDSSSFSTIPEKRPWQQMVYSDTFKRDYYDKKDGFKPRVNVL